MYHLLRNATLTPYQHHHSVIIQLVLMRTVCFVVVNDHISNFIFHLCAVLYYVDSNTLPSMHCKNVVDLKM